MKLIAVVTILLTLVGCDVNIYAAALEQAEESCKVNGGIERLNVTVNYTILYCKNGMNTLIKNGGNK